MQKPGVQKDNKEKMMGQLSVSGWWMRNVSVVSYILQKKSLNWTQSRRAASKLASQSICDARLGSMTPDWSMIGGYELELRLLSSISPTLLFMSFNTHDGAALHLSSVKVQERVRLLMAQESCWVKERES